MAERNVVRDKSFRFALRIVKLYQYLKEEKKEYVLSKQVLRSGTAIGALVRESQQAPKQGRFHPQVINRTQRSQRNRILD